MNDVEVITHELNRQAFMNMRSSRIDNMKSFKREVDNIVDYLKKKRRKSHNRDAYINLVKRIGRE